MRKIPTLFVRDQATNLVIPEVSPAAIALGWDDSPSWRATQKHDGTCCLVRNGVLYKRYDAKHGKTPPAGFEPAQEAADPITGHWPGWLRVGDEPDSRYHREAFGEGLNWPDGTYELVGPKIQGNPEKMDTHLLIPHGSAALHDAPRDFDGLRAYLLEHDIEGIVWHRKDGAMVKAKGKDWGLKRGGAHHA